MKRAFAFVLLLGLSACNRHGVADVTLDAAAAQRNATAAKTLADLQAADEASQGPAPAMHARPSAAPEAAAAPSAPEENQADSPVDDAADADSNG
ncbi:MAG: hypothetical protein JF628_15480 [Sphingomonas sp.]|nr:hypothetical protein [Sphingomonas sp.]